MKILGVLVALLSLLMLGCSGTGVVGIEEGEGPEGPGILLTIEDPPLEDVYIVIILPPGVDPDNPVVGADELVAFLAIATGGQGPLVYDWDFGDGASMPDGDLVAHTYAMAGTYTVGVLATDTLTGITAQDHLTLTVTGGQLITVEIDIKPGSYPNAFNNNGHGVIPVAILGSADFDVNQVDPATVTLEGLAIRIVGRGDRLLAHLEDINSDGFDDLVVQIEDSDSVFDPGTTMGTISGSLFDGTPFEGTDEITIVP